MEKMKDAKSFFAKIAKRIESGSCPIAGLSLGVLIILICVLLVGIIS